MQVSFYHHALTASLVVEGTQVLIEAGSGTIVLPNISSQAKRKNGGTDRISESTLELSFLSNSCMSKKREKAP